MKRLFNFFLAVSLLSSLPLAAQNFLNIRYTDGSNKNVPFTSLQKITFDETAGNVNIRLTDATTQGVAFTALQKMTSADAGAGSLLPVELVGFTAAAEKKNVVLSWQTATEINNAGFDVEKSETMNGKNTTWVKAGFVAGHGTTNAPQGYSFVDKPGSGKYSYRLKQIDRDGKYEYSGVVTIETGMPAAYELRQNFPNPFNPATTIAYKLPADGFVAIKIFDVAGREVATLVNENKKTGSYEVSFDGSRLSSGIYFCRMSAAAYSSITKMIIIK